LSPSRKEQETCRGTSMVRTDTSGLIRGLLVAHIWIVATGIPLLDKLLPLERVLRLLTPRRSFRLYRGTDPVLIGKIARRRLQRPIHMRRRACLRLSLVIYHFARLAGAEAVFHIAVFAPSVDSRRLHAHSWVTAGNLCLCEPPEGPACEIMQYGAGHPRTKTYNAVRIV